MHGHPEHQDQYPVILLPKVVECLLNNLDLIDGVLDDPEAVVEDQRLAPAVGALERGYQTEEWSVVLEYELHVAAIQRPVILNLSKFRLIRVLLHQEGIHPLVFPPELHTAGELLVLP